MYVRQDCNCLLDDLPLPVRINGECDIRAKSELRYNVINNSRIPPSLPHERTVYIIDGIKITDSVGEIIREKKSHRELKYLLYDRGILQFFFLELVDWTGFEHMTAIVPHLFQIWVVNMFLGLVGQMP